MRRDRLILGALLAAALPVAAARAQRAPAPAAVVARVQTTLDAATRDSVEAIAAEARGRGLPAEPLYTKALEGAEKGADGARIQAVVRAMFDRLETARAALAPSVSDAELVAGADALAVHVPAATLRQMRALSPGRSTAVPLGVLAQLVSRGVPVRKATDAVRALLARGGGSQQLLALERSVTDDIAIGMTPDAALDMRSRAMIMAAPAAPGASGTTNTDAATLSSTGSSGNNGRGKP